ncbi:uncharacterized protein LOC121754512 [Salvia splendens]|uniref:uncharacterized protein LOC121754512 n=1 Tax=Salvia splendens TaxID=180675 RepID=UPI001C25F859|nr:uncharacterized protein LOC121754512 [Salvia splendens]
MWFIWAERNRSRHDQVPFKPYNVIWQVQTFIRNGMSIGTIKPKHWRGMLLKMDVPSQVESRRPRPLAMQAKWHPPDQPWIKINTDGAISLVTGKAGGGGVVREDIGKVLAAFATPLDAQSALEADLMAIHHGLVIAKEFNRPIWIESDSEQAIKFFNGTTWGPAHICRSMARLAIL